MNKSKLTLLTAAVVIFTFSSCNQAKECKCNAPAKLSANTIERIDVGEHYSQIAMKDDLIILTGQVSNGSNITEQAEGIFKTIDSHLAKAGSDKSKNFIGKSLPNGYERI